MEEAVKKRRIMDNMTREDITTIMSSEAALGHEITMGMAVDTTITGVVLQTGSRARTPGTLVTEEDRLWDALHPEVHLQ